MNMEINPSEYKVLIVDDVISNVLLLKVLLTNEKFNIVTAGNGTQALEQVKKEKPDLVLLDVMMPDISGFEVAQQMKADPEMSEIPIIFLTALNSTADIVKGFQVGGNDFISKPFNKEELIIRVTHQISLVAAKRIIVAQTEELRKTIMGRDKLYSVIAHDLRSPMGSIKMVLNMLILNLPSETIGEEMYELLTMANPWPARFSRAENDRLRRYLCRTIITPCSTPARRPTSYCSAWTRARSSSPPRRRAARKNSN